MSEVLHLTDDDLEKKINEGGAVVVDFWAPWCGPCKMIGPIIDELAGVFNSQVTFVKINVDEQQRIAGMNGVTSIPTLLFYKDGKKVDALVGAMPKPMLEARVKNAFGI
ncbi:MAG TPA: thioredoxin [Caldisericia bacterium]|nr:thioredoxin [Caldisericia bacterium]HPF49724.1 thioredoxin [Caldisericia bacterium]HPI84567.1 thioredoxin [Caldisericia bacterium]HPQ93403.1 thioredoxin [Caldisericia bacterium]HRV74863.1 thioredoxin [Caldisericia bacterium]